MQVLNRARQVYQREGPKAALPIYQEALSLFRSANDRKGEAITLGLIGNCHKRFGDFSKALDFLTKALNMKRSLGDRLEEARTLSHLGLLHWEMSEYSKAIEELTLSVSLARHVGDQRLEAASLNNLGLVHDEMGNYRQSVGVYRRALEIERAVKEEADQSFTLGNIGGVHLLLGRYREALGYYEQSLAISERLDLKPSASQDLGNIGLAYLGLGKIAESIQTFDRALALARETGLKKEEADWNKGQGHALLRLGQYDGALRAFREAQMVYQQAGLQRELVEARLELANLYVELGDLGSSEKELQVARQLARRIHHPRGMMAADLALGDLEWRRKRFSRAESLYRNALALATEAKDDGHRVTSQLQLAMSLRDLGRLAEAQSLASQSLQASREIGATLLEAQALLTLGEIERQQNRFENAVEHYLAGENIAQPAGAVDLLWRLAYGKGQAHEALTQNEAALAAYQRAASAIETVRGKLRQDHFRAGYVEDKTQVYIAMVRLLLKLGRVSDAFTVAERLRATSTARLLVGGYPVPNPQVGSELRERIRRLHAALESEQTKPQTERRSLAVDQLSEELAVAERGYQDLLSESTPNDPLLKAIASLRVPSEKEIRTLLPENTALIEYVILDKQLAIFVATRQSLQATTVAEPKESLRGRVELLQDLVLRRNDEAWRKPAERLEQILVGPVEHQGWLKGISRLCIVPHGILHRVPFAALLRKGRFLVQDYSVSVLPAASMLQRPSVAKNHRERLLAMAPQRSRLLHAQHEVEQLAEVFPVESEVRSGKTATENAFKQLADGRTVLHLATHGHFNRWNPMFSFLELEPGKNDDGHLEVHEVLTLRLQARLVTLSACETALGSGYFTEIPAGEEFIGLTRAFLTAGSQAVLATLWEVNDRSTLDLMSSFYRGLKTAPPSEALARAQRTMLEGRKAQAHPYFWAPFVLSGALN